MSAYSPHIPFEKESTVEPGKDERARKSFPTVCKTGTGVLAQVFDLADNSPCVIWRAGRGCVAKVCAGRGTSFSLLVFFTAVA
jgi:hypothetical protein